MHQYILHNDRIHPSSEGVLRAGQVGLLSGWGVFSTLRIVEGVLFAFERHWARMTRDAKLLHVPMPPDSGAVRTHLLELVEANRAYHATMRVAIVRNCGGIWEGPDLDRSFDVIALTADSKRWGESVKLTYQNQARYAACMFAGTKILSWAMNLAWLETAQSEGFDEVILLNERGEVAECTSANIFVANGNQVWTPPLSSGCLPGITRELLLSEIRVRGISIGEKTLKPADLENADEVFITSTTRDLLPVGQIGNQPIPNSGTARDALQSAFSRYLNDYVMQARAVLK